MIANINNIFCIRYNCIDLINKLSIITVFFALLLLFSCGKSEIESPQVLEFKIESVKIDNKNVEFGFAKVTNIPVLPVLTIVFSHHVTAAELISSKNILLKNGNKNIPFSINQGGNQVTVIVTPNSPLDKASDYTLTILEDLSVTVEGKSYKLEKDASLTFSTVSQSSSAELKALTITINGEDVVGTINESNVTFFVSDKTQVIAIVKAISVIDKATSKSINDTLRFDNGSSDLIVTAEDGKTSKTYILHLINNLPKLNSLTLTIGTKDYTAEFNNTETIVSLAVIDDNIEGGIIKEVDLVAGALINPKKDGTFTFTNRETTFEVTAEDGETTKTYTVRLLNNLVNLSEIVLVLDLTEYTVTFTDLITSTTLPVVNDKIASGTIKKVTLSKGATIVPDKNKSITFINRLASVTVFAEDGITNKVYTIQLVSKQAELYSITLTIDSIDYSATFTNSSALIPVSNATIESALLKEAIFSVGATVNPIKGAMLNFENRQATIIVTAEDGNTNNLYTLNLVSNQAKLIDLTLTIDSIDYLATFTDITTATTFVIDDTIPNAAIKDFNISPNASLSKEKNLIVDFVNKQLSLLVTAEDGVTKQNYTLTLQNAALSLSALTLRINNSEALLKIVGDKIYVVVTDKSTVNRATITNIVVDNDATTTPSQGENLDFTISGGSKQSTITVSQNGVNKVYTVILKLNTNKITNFKFIANDNLGIDSDVIGQITHTEPNAGNITVELSTLENYRFTPTLGHNGVSISPVADIEQDFNSGITYDVTSEYGATRTYTVTLNKGNPKYTFVLANDEFITGENPLEIPKGTVPQIPEPSKSGFRFVKWYKDNSKTIPYDLSSLANYSTKLYPKWIAQFSITYELNGGRFTENIANPQLFNEGTAKENIPTPIKDNAIFDGWFTDTTFLKIYNKSIDADATLYAKWTNQYKVTFVLNQGTPTETLTNPRIISDGKTLEKSTLPTIIRGNYRFVDWYTDAEKTIAYVAAPITKDFTLYAKWEIIKYNITYNLGANAYLPTGITNPQLINSGTRIEKNDLPTPLRTDYDFVEWFTNPEKTTPYVGRSIIEDFMLHAKWTEVQKYNVYFDLDNGQLVGETNPKVIDKGATLSSTDLPTPTKQGHRFTGWFTNTAKTTPFSSTTVNSNITLYANWIEQVRITFDLRDGQFRSTTTNIVDIDKGKSLVLPENPTKTDYVFAGWYNSDTNTAYLPSPIIANLTLYAKWEGKYTVTYDLDGGEIPGVTNSQQLLLYGTQASALPRPYKNDYVFDAWYTDSTYTSVFTGTITSAIKLYAKWKKILNVELIYKGGTFSVEIENPLRVVENNVPVLPNNITREHYIFKGWYAGKINYVGKPITSNIRLFAKWEKETFDITYTLNGGQFPSGKTVQNLVKYNGIHQLISPERANKFFLGWFRDVELKTPYNYPERITSDLTIYAKWGSESLRPVIKFAQEDNLFINNLEGVVATMNMSKNIIVYDLINGITIDRLSKLTISISNVTASNRTSSGLDTDFLIPQVYSFTIDGVTEEYKIQVNPISPANVTIVTTIIQKTSVLKGESANLNFIDVSNITDFTAIIPGANANYILSEWDMSSAKICTGMFNSKNFFNSDISNWDMSSVTHMDFMFFLARDFNQDLSLWDVSSVTNASYMFNNAINFNSDLSLWDVSSMTKITSMFSISNFNQDLSLWDVSSVTDMSSVFYSATAFNQDLTSWDVSSNPSHLGMFNSANAMREEFKPKFN